MPSHHKYEEIQKLDAGGMAEVIIARAVGAAGITKKVAIKRVLPHLATNEKFVRMFLDEARVGMRLSHANIVQTFDVGNDGGTYFIVMEFVDGVSLKRVLDTLRSQGRVVPVGTGVYIAAEVARGLAYAHGAVDEQGRSLGIVHRDVSPPNILLSQQGEVKVTDFGLAKAASQLEHTDPGVVKGKFSYLSPEAIDGLEVDGRADVFALGVVLFELLAGRRLFLGETDYQTVQLVSRCHIPPLSVLNPSVPQLLDDIVHRALARDRRHRYQDADEFAEALTSFLYAASLRATSKHVADLVAEVQGKRHHRTTVKLAQRLVKDELLRGLSDEPATMQPSAGAGGSVDTRSWISDLGLDDLTDADQTQTEREQDMVVPRTVEPTPHEQPPHHDQETGTPGSGFFRRLFGK